MTRPRRSDLPTAPTVRQPLQDRSKEVWQRIVDAGLDVLCELGVARFSVSAVCKRAGVAATAVYSRVNSRDDLLHAVYDHGADRLDATENAWSSASTPPDAHAALEVLFSVFTIHADFLRATVLGAPDDEYIAAHGVTNLTRARRRFVTAAVGPKPQPQQRDAASALFSAAFSVLAFELAFGTRFTSVTGTGDARSQLRVLADAVVEAMRV